MSPESIQSCLAVALGFAVAGIDFDRLPAHDPIALPSLPPARQRRRAGGPFAAVPFLAFAAPVIIMRNTIRGRRIERRRIEFVMLATVAAGFWSMMSGTVVVMLLEAVERLLA